MERNLEMARTGRMALVLLAGIVAMAIAGTACRKSDGAAVPQRAPPCETAGRMNLVALAGIPALGRVISEWLQSGSNELAGAFRNGQIPPLEGMRVARLCQTSRRAPSGSREMAVTLSGNEVPALYARLAAAAPPGKPLRIETWGTAEILTGERTWVALHDGRLVIATTDELLRRLVSGPVDGEIGDDDALLSLSFTGQALADILSGGQPFRAATLNAVRALHVDVGSDGTRLSARLSTSDAPAAAELLAALQKFLDGFKEAMKRGGPQRPIDVSVRGVGADVVVSAVFGKEALDSFVQNLAARVARGHVRPRVAAGPH